MKNKINADFRRFQSIITLILVHKDLIEILQNVT